MNGTEFVVIVLMTLAALSVFYIMWARRQSSRHLKKEVWRQLCREIGADYIEEGFWGTPKVVAKVKEWTITLDTYIEYGSEGSSATCTRMRAPYVNQDGFSFRIYRKDMFSELGKRFGMQDIQVEYLDFDRDFIIKGNSEGKVRALFANPRIRQLIQAQPSILLSVHEDEGWSGPSFPEGVDELYFNEVLVIKDVKRLKSLFDLFTETLNQLCHIGSASEENPNVVL